MKCPELRLLYKLEKTGGCHPNGNYVWEYAKVPTLQYESRDDKGNITWVDVEEVYEERGD